MKENSPESAPHVYATSAPAGGTWRRDAELTLQKNVNCSIFISVLTISGQNWARLGRIGGRGILVTIGERGVLKLCWKKGGGAGSRMVEVVAARKRSVFRQIGTFVADAIE